MRCIVCDYCDTEGSLYRGSLIDPKGSKSRHVFVDRATGDEICNYCYENTTVSTGFKEKTNE